MPPGGGFFWWWGRERWRRGRATGARERAPRPPRLSLSLSLTSPLLAHLSPRHHITQPIPKPSRAAQATLPGAKRVPWSDVFTVAKTRAWIGRTWAKTDKAYAGFMLAMHGLALLAPMTFSWKMVGLFLATYFVSGE